MQVTAATCFVVTGAIFAIIVEVFSPIHPTHSVELTKLDIEPNNDLLDAEHIFPDLYAPEDIVEDPSERIAYLSMGDGQIVKMKLDGSQWLPFTRTGENRSTCGALEEEPYCGRPLGMVLIKQKHLYKRFIPNNIVGASPLLLVADAYKGLLMVLSDGSIVPLVTSVNGRPFRFANAMAVAKNGTVYMSDTSARFQRNKVMLEIMESGETGRIIAFHPQTAESHEILTDLPFPNGLALINNDSTLLIALTSRHHIVQCQLLHDDQPKRSLKLFASLPGNPDNMHLHYDLKSKRQLLWVGLATKQTVIARTVARFPYLRKVLGLFPLPTLIKFLKPYGVLLALDVSTGNIVHVFQDPTARTAYIAGVHFIGEFAYIGSWKNSFLARLPSAKIFDIIAAES